MEIVIWRDLNTTLKPQQAETAGPYWAPKLATLERVNWFTNPPYPTIENTPPDKARNDTTP